MKTMITFLVTLLTTASTLTLNANAMCGDKPKPQAEMSCCCCAKMQKQTAEPTLEQLLDAVKEAKGDQRLDALAAVVDKLLEERKATPATDAPAAGEAHHH